ncbi:efflux RND transporter periplasmic adaptor subunit [Desulfobacter sp.]|uniref:HlyD family secretion protein n=1 Tax=Desulfobacter sp. TaxID=2294 RepID=UPI0025804ADF|nr:efflux RND transporter periplasmic adaptor subunit [Desulfobacter sp.]
MKFLRDDLIIDPVKDGDRSYIIRSPLKNVLYEADEKEYFLINAFRHPYQESVLLARFNAKFGLQEPLAFITDFITKLDEKGLLTDSGAEASGHRINSAPTPLPEAEQYTTSCTSKNRLSSAMKAAFIKVRWRRCLLTAAAVVILFLPYQYEVSGSVVVSPVLNQQIYAEAKGIIKRVCFSGGEWLKKGTLIAEMENYQQKKDVEVTRLAIEDKRENILVLLTTPKPEEVALAKQQVLTAKLKLKYSQIELQRAEALYEGEVISLTDYEDAKEKMEQDQQEVAQQKANLLYIENQVNEHQIEAAKLELAILERQLQYYENQLERTMLRMPNDGRIVTMNLKNLENKFLDETQFFAEIEDVGHVQIEISIPEAEKDQVTVGDKVRLKTQAFPGTMMTGRVTSIYPVTESSSSGVPVVKVVCVIPNGDGMLKTGMSGYAKVEGDEMFVLQAFTRPLVNFFLVDFWSWLP